MTALALVLIVYQCTTETFLFEVSPGRLKCMEEDVSRYSDKRTCGCCNKGFRGASTLGYQEWTRGDDWIRTDSYTDTLQKKMYMDQIRPTTLVQPQESELSPVNRFTDYTL